MLAPWLIFGFFVGGLAVAFLVRSRVPPLSVVLTAVVVGFSLSTALVVLQRLVFRHFFDFVLFAEVDSSLDLFVFATGNAFGGLAGFFAGGWLAAKLLPGRAQVPPAIREPPEPEAAPPSAEVRP